MSAAAASPGPGAEAAAGWEGKAGAATAACCFPGRLTGEEQQAAKQVSKQMSQLWTPRKAPRVMRKPAAPQKCQAAVDLPTALLPALAGHGGTCGTSANVAPVQQGHRWKTLPVVTLNKLIASPILKVHAATI